MTTAEPARRDPSATTRDGADAAGDRASVVTAESAAVGGTAPAVTSPRLVPWSTLVVRAPDLADDARRLLHTGAVLHTTALNGELRQHPCAAFFAGGELHVCTPQRSVATFDLQRDRRCGIDAHQPGTPGRIAVYGSVVAVTGSELAGVAAQALAAGAAGTASEVDELLVWRVALRSVARTVSAHGGTSLQITWWQPIEAFGVD